MTEKAKRGSHGGNARSAKLTPEQRSAIAKDAAKRRWAKKDEPNPIIDPEITKEVDYLANGVKKSLDTVLAPLTSPPVVTYHSDPYAIHGVPMQQIYIAPPTATPEPPKPIKKRNKPMVKEFGKAHSYAEKRLAEALKERAESMNKVAMLNAEIPSLVQIIKALGMTPNMNGFQDFTAPIPNMNPYAAPVYQPIPQQQQVEPTGPPPNIDPNLYAANAGPLPGLVPAAKNMPVIPGMSAGGALDLDYVPAPEDEGPGLPKMGSGWV